MVAVLPSNFAASSVALSARSVPVAVALSRASWAATLSASSWVFLACAIAYASSAS